MESIEKALKSIEKYSKALKTYRSIAKHSKALKSNEKQWEYMKKKHVKAFDSIEHIYNIKEMLAHGHAPTTINTIKNLTYIHAKDKAKHTKTYTKSKKGLPMHIHTYQSKS